MDAGDIPSTVICFFIIALVGGCAIEDNAELTSEEHLKGVEDGYNEFNSTKLEFCEEYLLDTGDPLSGPKDYQNIISVKRYCRGYIEGYEKREWINWQSA